MKNQHPRRKGTENALVRIKYSDIARLSGMALNTVKQYAWRKKYDQHDLDSVLKLIVASRKKRGLPPLGE